MPEIRPGMQLIVTDAHGEDHVAFATSEVRSGDKFPVVWVEIDYDVELPWPVEYVQIAKEGHQ